VPESSVRKTQTADSGPEVRGATARALLLALALCVLLNLLGARSYIVVNRYNVVGLVLHLRGVVNQGPDSALRGAGGLSPRAAVVPGADPGQLRGIGNHGAG